MSGAKKQNKMQYYSETFKTENYIFILYYVYILIRSTPFLFRFYLLFNSVYVCMYV